MSQSSKKFPWLNLLLFIATFFTTLFFGAFHYISFYNLDIENRSLLDLILSFRFFLYGLPFSLSLMIILVSHELGHYFACRYYGIEATLPFFIPAPTIIGTFGAFIKIKSYIYSRRALFDIGVAGPITGFVVALPFLFYGIQHSKLIEKTPEGLLQLGDPLLFKLLYPLFFKEGSDTILIHPIGFAAWVGLLVTSLNLLPVGQLDGGHIAYSLFGPKAKYLSATMFGFIIYLGLTKWNGWLIWAALLVILGIKHPEFLYEDQLDFKRYIIAFLVLIIFILSFIPAPVSVKF